MELDAQTNTYLESISTEKYHGHTPFGIKIKSRGKFVSWEMSNLAC